MAMAEKTPMFEHILIPLDGSSLAERVLPHAISLSKAFGAKLTLLRVVYQVDQKTQLSGVNPIDWQMRMSEAEAYIDSVRDRLVQKGIETDGCVLEGRPAQQIINFAKKSNLDLIILSSHGNSGISGWNINSTVQKVLLRAYMPVMIVRAYQEMDEETESVTYKRLLVPLDGSKRAECILPLVKSISEVQGSNVLLTHIIEEPKLLRPEIESDDVKSIINQLNEINLREIEAYFDEIRSQFDPNEVEIIIEKSEEPTIALHDIIDREEIDLVLLSAHGYSGKRKWPYGKIALNFISFGTTPLIIIQDLSADEIQKSLAERIAEQSKGH